MKFKLNPLAYLIMLAISNSIVPAHAADEVPLPVTTAYPDALKDQLPDFEHAAGNGVSFQGPASTYTGTTPPAPALDVNTTEKNTLINWGGRGFDVGADATVNFKPGVEGTAILNYDTSGNMSIVNGAVNGNGAKLFLVNPDGISDTSGSFTALISNDAENVTLGNDGRLRIKNAGDRIYGSVSGPVDTSQDLTVDLVNGSGINTSNMILGGDKTTINISNPDTGSNLISNTQFAANNTEITASEGSSATLRLEKTTGGNLTINNFDTTTVAGQTDLSNVTVNNASVLSTFSSDSATGKLTDVTVNNGSVDLTQTGGILLIDGMKHTSYLGNFEASVQGGAVLDIRNSRVNLNSDGDVEDTDSLPAGVADREIDNSALFSTDTGGGTVNLTNSQIIVEGSIYFEDNLKVGTLNLKDTDLLVPEANILVTPGTKITMGDGFALDSDFDPSGYTRGVIVVDKTKTEGTIDAGKQYYTADQDYSNYASEKTVTLAFNQITASGGGAMENRSEFADATATPSAPSDIPNTGDGQESDPPVVDIPEAPSDGTDPTTPVDEGSDPSTGDDGTTTPGDGSTPGTGEIGTNPGTGDTDTGTGPSDGDNTDPTDGDIGTTPGTDPDNGSGDEGTDPGDGDTTLPGDGDDGTTPGTDPTEGTGDDGSDTGDTDPVTTPGDGETTTPGDGDTGANPGTGGETEPGTDPGQGGTTEPGDDTGTTPGTDPSEGTGGDGSDPGTTPGTDPTDGGTTEPGTGDTGTTPGTDPSDETGSGGDTDPVTDPGTDPTDGGTTEPGTGGDGTTPGTDPDNEGGSGGSTDPVTNPGTDPTDGGTTEPGTGDDGTTPGDGTGQDGSGSDGDTDPATDPGTDPTDGGTSEPGTGDSGTTPGTGSGTDPVDGSNGEGSDGGTTDPVPTPGDGSTAEPGNGDTDTNPGTDPIGEPGGADGGDSDPVTTPGTDPVDGGSTEPGSGDTGTIPGTNPDEGAGNGDTDTGVNPGNGDSGSIPGSGTGESGSTLPGVDDGTNPVTEPGGGSNGESTAPVTNPADGDANNPGAGGNGLPSDGSNPGSSNGNGSQADHSASEDILDNESNDPFIDQLLESPEDKRLMFEDKTKECEEQDGQDDSTCEKIEVL